MRNGGMAIYGGIIGGVITCVIYCKKRKINIICTGTYKLTDIGGVIALD